MRLAPAAGSLALGLLGTACSLFGGVRVERVQVSARKPANVAFYVAVTEQGEPVTDLERKNFRIYEDGHELAPGSIQRTLLPRDPVTSEHVLLLVDLSGKPSAREREAYAAAVEAFVRKVARTAPVAVRAFDGSSALKPVGDYARGTDQVSAQALTKLVSRDESRNLNGAVVAGLGELDRVARSDNKPIVLGTLVVFARGPDLAGRTAAGELERALDATAHDVIGIGIGDSTPFLGFAEDGVVHAQSADTLPIAFEEAGARVAATLAKYYLVAYCSPARAGTRRVRLEVVHEDAEGNAHSGSVDYELDASGFGPGCDSETLPRFEHADARAEAAKPAEPPRVNQAPATPPDVVVPPPSSGDYAK